jgi:hypothetical protein
MAVFVRNEEKNHMDNKKGEGSCGQYTSAMTAETTKGLADILDFGVLHLCSPGTVKLVNKSAFPRVRKSHTLRPLHAPEP